ncbi:MAG: hypothetical protein E7376_03420 [Clostridiales bacterium]|nr:hypothetical protein [Clostridiales bacterium]
MKYKEFLGQSLLAQQDVVSLLGPSGTGKSFCAIFLEKFGYKIVPQITTRKPRPDDKHYTYVSHKQFVDGLNNGKILGYYSGDIKTLSGGNGYGYSIEKLKELLQNPTAKLILFPSAYELQESDFVKKYGNTTKIAITFLNPYTVVKRAQYAGKVFSSDEILSRINMVKELTTAMNQYANRVHDKNFHIILSDSFGENRQQSEKEQLKQVCKLINIPTNQFEEYFKE